MFMNQGELDWRNIPLWQCSTQIVFAYWNLEPRPPTLSSKIPACWWHLLGKPAASGRSPERSGLASKADPVWLTRHFEELLCLPTSASATSPYLEASSLGSLPPPRASLEHFAFHLSLFFFQCLAIGSKFVNCFTPIVFYNPHLVL